MFEKIKIRRYLKKIEKEILRMLPSSDKKLHEEFRKMVKAGGKRFRPAFLVAATRITDANKERLIRIGAAIEIFHTSSLIHDDVVDHGILRRGIETFYAGYGSAAGVSAGNILLCTSLHIFKNEDEKMLYDIFSDTSIKMCLGEIEQLAGNNEEFSVIRYLKNIKNKTALMVSSCLEAGGILSNDDEKTRNVLKKAGYYIGMGFQIHDDILDLTSDRSVLGKETDTDAANGIYTLPVLLVLREGGSPQDAESIKLGIKKAEAVRDRYFRKAEMILRKIDKERYGKIMYIADKLKDRDK